MANSTTGSQSAKSTSKAATTEENGHAPIIIDLGKKSRKQIRKLRKGKPGRLLETIEEAIAHLRETETLAPDVQPIVVVVKERARRPGNRIAKAWGLG